VTNFENANLEKISKASAEQIDAINLIIKKGKFDTLPDELKQTAKLRLDNIELSTQEIGVISNPPISKSGITHRMRKLINISKELEEGKHI
jgi:DNA-binding protein WhiA